MDIYHHNAKAYTIKYEYKSIRYPISQFLGYDRFSEAYKAYSINFALTHEPETYEEAIVESHWRKAIQEELKTLVDNKTWSIVKRTHDMRPIRCRFVFKT